MKTSIWHIVPVVLLFNSALFAQTPEGASASALDNYWAGRNLESQNRMSEANALYNEAIRISQDEIARNAATRDTYTVMTWAMRRQNKHSDVLFWGERGLGLFADEYRIIETMGQSLFYLGDYARSLSYMQRYLGSVPNGGSASMAFFFIGEIHRLRSRFRHADIAYSMAVRLEPALPLWWFRLGSVREAAGDFSHAQEAYERAIAINPNYQEANTALARSRSLVEGHTSQ